MSGAPLTQVIERARSALGEGLAVFVRFLEELPVAVFVLDADGRPFYANGASARILGRSIDPSVPVDQLPRTYRVFRAGTNELYPAERLPAVLALRGEDVHATDLEIERDGRRTPVIAWASPLRDADGRVAYSVTTFVEGNDKPTKILELLQRVSSAANDSDSVAGAVRSALEEICRHMSWPIGHAYLVALDETPYLPSIDHWMLTDPQRSASFRDETRRQQSEQGVGLVQRVHETRQATWVDDIANDATFTRAEAAREAGLRSAFAFPILVRREVVGILEFFSTETITPSEPLKVAVAQIGTMLGRVIERARTDDAIRKANEDLAAIVAELERHNREINLLNEMGDLLQSARTIEEAHAVIERSARRLFPYRSGSLYEFEALHGRLEPIASWGGHDGAHDPIHRDECWALRRGRPHLVDEGSDAPRCPHARDIEDGTLCVPLMAQGAVVALLHLRTTEQRPPVLPRPIDADLQLATRVGEHLGLALGNFRLRETLRNQSIRDPLTGLFNRRYMEESLARECHRAGRADAPLAVVMIDIDHFKRFNDELGHEAGDALLRALGAFLRENVRAGDIPCRYGGEEIALILPGATPEVAERRAEQLRQDVKLLRIPGVAGARASVTMSAGVASFGLHGTTGDQLLRAADRALYAAKNTGRDRVRIAASQDPDDATP